MSDGKRTPFQRWQQGLTDTFPGEFRRFSSREHWLKFDDARNIIGCQCGFAADVEMDSGYGDSVVDHIAEVAAAEALAADSPSPRLPEEPQP